VLTPDEQDRWRHIEADLAGEPRLARRYRKLTAIRIGVGLPVRTCLFWLLGGLTGVVVLIAGSLAKADDLVVAGTAVLIATVLISGGLLIATGLRTD
jgi:hypothetical protein